MFNPSQATKRTSGNGAKSTLSENEKRLREVFDMIDRDRSGKISARELAVTLRMQGQEISDSEVAEILKLMDEDHDGSTLSFEEFKHIFAAAELSDHELSTTEITRELSQHARALHMQVLTQHGFTPLWETLERERAAQPPAGESQAHKTRDAWGRARMQLAKLIDSDKVQAVLFVLVVLDMFVIWGELLLVFTACKNDEYCEAHGCHIDGSEHHLRALAESSSASEDDDETVFDLGGLSDKQHKWEVVLHSISLSILGLLGLHIVLTLVAYGRAFFRNPFYIFDMIVVGAALGMEAAHISAGPLVVVLMSWRVLRIAHAAFIAYEVQHHSKHKSKAKAAHRARFVEKMKYHHAQRAQSADGGESLKKGSGFTAVVVEAAAS